MAKRLNVNRDYVPLPKVERKPKRSRAAPKGTFGGMTPEQAAIARAKGKEKRLGKGIHYSRDAVRRHIEALETLMLRELMNERQCMDAMMQLAARGEIPELTRRRVGVLYHRIQAAWSERSREDRKHDWAQRVLELLELIRLCRVGVREQLTAEERAAGKKPGWITRPNRHTEVMARAELHRIMGMYADKPLVQFVQNNVGAGGLGDASPGLLRQIANGCIPFLSVGERKALDVRSESDLA